MQSVNDAPASQPATPTRASRPATTDHADLKAAVLSELLAVRKTSEGLSPHSITTCPTIVGLLGDGDPLLAFTQLQARILGRLELDDDVTQLEAAAYSLGLASHGRTHLERLTDFGEAFGYEARQARRHSDAGLRQLATLVCSNWTIETTPALQVTISQQTDGNLGVQIVTERPRFIDMRPVQIQWLHTDNQATTELQAIEPEPTFKPATTPAAPSATSLPDDLQIRQQLTQPITMPTQQVPEHRRALRIAWPGEIWPRFELHLAGPLPPSITISSQTIGNAMVLTLPRHAGPPSAD